MSKNSPSPDGSLLRSTKRKLLDAECLTEGWLYRETSVVGLVNRRYGAVYPTTFVTYRKDDANTPTKAWPLEDGCKVTPVKEGEFMVRDKGTSTLWALARGHYSKAHLFSFYLKYPPGHVHHKDPLKLCFEQESTAHEWQAAFRKAVGPSVELQQRPSSSEAVVESPFASETSPSYKQAQVTSPGTRGAGPLSEALRDPWGKDQSETFAGSRRSTVSHVNGVAVYQEPGGSDGSSGASMVSAVVSAHPRDVFLALSTLGKKTPVSFNWRLIERVDPQARIVHHEFIPMSGFFSKLCAPRETVMQQTWREQEDGTISMLGRSVSHQQLPEQASWSWFVPIRAKVESAGFTIAPLQSRYQAPGGSESCLVTFVLKMDLGGWLSETSWAATLFRPFVRHMHDLFVQPLLMAVIALRDQVEQARYTVQPFVMPGASQPAESDRSAGRGGSGFKSLISRQLKSMTSVRVSPGELRSSVGTGAAGDSLPETIGEGEEAGAEAGFSSWLEDMHSLATLDQRFWSCPGAAGFHVRGPTYLQDRKKIPAEEPIFSLASVDLVQVGRRPSHVAPFLPCIKKAKMPFGFVLNLMVPGPQQLALAITWAAEQAPPQVDESSSRRQSTSSISPSGDSESEAGGAPFDILLARFLAGDDAAADERRNATLKLIPSIVKGSWIVRQSVGHTPVLLGKKLTTKYYRGENYMEVDVDIGSSRAANSVVGMVQGAASGLVIELGIVLEGHSDEELPECLLGTVRLTNLDMKAFKVLSEGENEASPSEAEKKSQ